MTTPRFALDSRLANDTVAVRDLDLCTVRLMNDARFPWLILVPMIPDAVELVDLGTSERQALVAETDRAAVALRDLTACDKLNVAAIGNIVRQLHVHVVARFATDAAWPGPVWGHGPSRGYDPSVRQAFVADLSAALAHP